MTPVYPAHPACAKPEMQAELTEHARVVRAKRKHRPSRQAPFPVDTSRAVTVTPR